MKTVMSVIHGTKQQRKALYYNYMRKTLFFLGRCMYENLFYCSR